MKTLRSLLLFLLVLTSRNPAAGDLPEPDLKPEFLQRLCDPAQRMAAMVELEERTTEKKWTDNERRVAPLGIDDPRVTLCPPREAGGAPLFLVSYRANWEARNSALSALEGEPGTTDEDAYPPLPSVAKKEEIKPPPPPTGAGETDGLWSPPATVFQKRVLTFMTPEGRVTWPFGGDNMIDPGWLADFDKDGVLDRADSTNWGNPVEGARPTSIKGCRILSIETSPRLLLSVIYNWSDDGPEWGFEMLDVDGNGVLEACLGPKEKDKDTLASCEVVYRWNAAKKEWQGPEGSREDHFLRYRGKDDDFWDWLTKVSKGGGLTNKKPAPRTPVKLPPRPADAAPQPAVPPGPPPGLSADALTVRFYLGTVGGEAYYGVEAVLPPPLWGLPPKEAALTLANANRTAEHRGHYELLTDPEAKDPPAAGTVQLFQKNYWSSSFCTLLEVTADSARWIVVDEKGPCSANPVKVEEGRWLFQTLWWLDRVRTRLVAPLTSPGSGTAWGAHDVPDYTLVLTAENGGPGVSLPRRSRRGLGPRWEEHYDRNIAHRLCVEVWEAWAGRHQIPPIREQKPDAALMLEQLRTLKPDTKEFLALWARAVIPAAGYAASAEALPELERISKALPADSELAKDASTARDMIAAEQDRARLIALSKSKKDSDAPAAARAREILEQTHEEEIMALLKEGKPVPLGKGEAERNIPLMIRAGHTAEAIAWYRGLKRKSPDRLVWLLELLPKELQRDKSWREDLIRALASVEKNGKPDWCGKAVRYLVPPDLPMLHEGADIDALLVRLIETARPGPQNPLAPWAAGGAESAFAAALVRRATDASRVEIISRCAVYDYFNDNSAEGWLNEAEAALAHLAVKFPAVAAEKLTTLIKARLQKSKGRDSAAAFLAWTADLRALEPQLQKQATPGPETEETDFAHSWGGSHEVADPTHAARRVIGIWREANSLTRAKALICLAALKEFREEAPGLYGPASRLRDQFAAALTALPEADRKNLEEFVNKLPELNPDISLERGADLPAARQWAREAMKRP